MRELFRSFAASFAKKGLDYKIEALVNNPSHYSAEIFSHEDLAAYGRSKELELSDDEYALVVAAYQMLNFGRAVLHGHGISDQYDPIHHDKAETNFYDACLTYDSIGARQDKKSELRNPIEWLDRAIAHSNATDSEIFKRHVPCAMRVGYNKLKDFLELLDSKSQVKIEAARPLFNAASSALKPTGSEPVG